MCTGEGFQLGIALIMVLYESRNSIIIIIMVASKSNWHSNSKKTARMRCRRFKTENFEKLFKTENFENFVQKLFKTKNFENFVQKIFKTKIFEIFKFQKFSAFQKYFVPIRPPARVCYHVERRSQFGRPYHLLATFSVFFLNFLYNI